MIADAPIQTVVSPISQHRLSLVSPTVKPAAQRTTHTGYMGNNGHVSTPQSSPPKPAQLVTIPSITREEHLAVMSNSRGSDCAPPMLRPKFRDQVQNDVDTAVEEDGDEVYNLPRQDLYRPQLIDYYQQDEKTYDTPPQFKQHAANSCNDDDDDDDDDDDNDTYDMPPTVYRDEGKDSNTDADNDIYDFPPMKVSTNVTSYCPPPANHAVASHHIYSNVVNSVSVVTTGPVFSDVKYTDRLSTDSDNSDQIVMSPRSRSFKSSDSWCVFQFKLCHVSKLRQIFWVCSRGCSLIGPSLTAL